MNCDKIEEYAKCNCVASNMELEESCYALNSFILTFRDRFDKGFEFERDVNTLKTNMENEFKDFKFEDPLFEVIEAYSDIDGDKVSKYVGYVEIMKK